MMKMLKVLTMVFSLAAVALAADWTGSAVEPENMKKIDGKAFYVITTADELAWFAAQVNSGKSVNGVLSANITLGTTYAWTPIGKDSTKMFQNVFDGGNYTITTPYTTTGNFAGLFGVIGANGVVKNVKVASPNITHTRNGGTIAGFNNGLIDNVVITGGSVNTTSDSAYSGGVAGRNNGTISNGQSSVSITKSCSIKSISIGGIVGENLKSAVVMSMINSGSMTGCLLSYNDSKGRSYGSMSFHYIGGIAGYNAGNVIKTENIATIRDSINGGNYGKVDRLHTGGITGYNVGTVERSINKGNVHNGIYDRGLNDYAGGVAAYNAGTIRECENRAKVDYYLSNNVNVSISILLGGISAYNKGIVQNSLNMGEITYSQYLAGGTGAYSHSGYSGGVVATNDGSGAIIKNSFSISTVIKAYSAKGGIAGQNLNSAQIINSYYDQTLLSSVSAPVGTQSATMTYSGGKSTADMKKDQFAWILNTTNGTTANSGAWSRIDGYSIFATEDNKAIYKVVFNDDGVTTNRYTNFKGLVSFPEDPEPAEGYIFSGWYNTDDIKVKPTTVFTVDQTVKAIYTDASDVFWTINFYNAAPADTVLESKSYQHGSIVAYGGVAPTLAPTAKYTYTFKGWNVEPTNAVEDFDYHAVYDSTIRSYTVTFNNADGSKIESATFEYGKMPSCSKTPTRKATAEWTYSHKGWKPALDYVTEAATYTAIYDSSKVKYKVTFMNGTTVIDEQMVPYGDPAVAPTNVTREGYKFVGWNTSFATVTEALTVKALFEELIIRTVNVVDVDGDKIVNTTVEDGEKYALPEAPKKEGYTFDAYYDGDKKLGVAGDEISVTANITITAKYIENPKSSSSQQEIATSSSSSRNDKSSSSQREIASSSSTPRNDKSSSSKAVSSSSSRNDKSSSSQREIASSSSTLRNDVSSSSSVKTSAIVASVVPRFLVQVNGRNLQISAARIGAGYALFDMQGKVLLQGRVQTANFEIPVMRAGSYLLKIESTTQRVSVR